jgi:hypothetical protein
LQVDGARSRLANGYFEFDIHLMAQVTSKRGSVLIYTTIASSAIIGFAAMAIDVGRLQAAKSDLQTAVDAAARHAATGIRDNSMQAKAIAAANENRVDGALLSLNASNVQVGKYDPAARTFTVNGTPTNAVRVRVTRANGIGADTNLARVLGINRVNFDAESLAYDNTISIVAATPPPSTPSNPTGGINGFVGMDWFNMNGPLTLRAWDSSTQAVTPAAAWAVARTRGPSNLNSGVNIQGELQTSSSVSMNSATITRGVTSLPAGFGTGTYAMPTTPATGVTNMGNYNGPSGASQTFAAGKYYFDTFQVPSGKTVTFSGPVELYVNGSTNITGTVITSGNIPSNLKIFGVSGSGMDIGSGATALYAEIYAPNSPMNLNNRTFYGSMIVKGVSVNSAFTMNIDARATPGGFSVSTTPTPPPTPTTTTPVVVRARPTTIN